ncbi:MAG: 5-formyltetrahydrofolate cyclo-ligase [Gammaproteobacteria bacterium]
MPDNSTKATDSVPKNQLRQLLLQRRDGLNAELRSQKNQAILKNLQAIPELVAARKIFCFISRGSEADTHAVLDWLLAQGKTLAIPRLVSQAEMIAVAFSNWDELQPGPTGIPEPVSSTEYTEAFDVCMTPGLGFTESGLRLGYGLGYYDKWLARHTTRLKLALCYECQLLDALPAEEHDVPVDMIVTEARTIRVQ